jgi:hypothetical protein
MANNSSDDMSEGGGGKYADNTTKKKMLVKFNHGKQVGIFYAICCLPNKSNILNVTFFDSIPLSRFFIVFNNESRVFYLSLSLVLYLN